jgi:hypothetical protein
MTITCYIDIDKVPTITTMLQHHKPQWKVSINKGQSQPMHRSAVVFKIGVPLLNQQNEKFKAALG